jgi:hypothetical protein
MYAPQPNALLLDPLFEELYQLLGLYLGKESAAGLGEREMRYASVCHARVLRALH